MSEIAKCLSLLTEAVKLLEAYTKGESAKIPEKKDDKLISVFADTKKIKVLKAKKEDTRTPEERAAAREKMAKLRELRKSKPKAETKLDAV